MNNTENNISNNQIVDELDRYNHSIKSFLQSLKKMSKSNMESISFIFYFYSMLGKKFFNFETPIKQRRHSKLNQNM